MRYRINFTWPDGTEDSIIVSGENETEIQLKAMEVLGARNPIDIWSERLSDAQN